MVVAALGALIGGIAGHGKGAAIGAVEAQLWEQALVSRLERKMDKACHNKLPRYKVLVEEVTDNNGLQAFM